MQHHLKILQEIKKLYLKGVAFILLVSIYLKQNRMNTVTLKPAAVL